MSKGRGVRLPIFYDKEFIFLDSIYIPTQLFDILKREQWIELPILAYPKSIDSYHKEDTIDTVTLYGEKIYRYDKITWILIYKDDDTKFRRLI